MGTKTSFGIVAILFAGFLATQLKKAPSPAKPIAAKADFTYRILVKTGDQVDGQTINGFRPLRESWQSGQWCLGQWCRSLCRGSQNGARIPF